MNTTERNDRSSLARPHAALMTDDLTFTHANAVVETKARGVGVNSASLIVTLTAVALSVLCSCDAGEQVPRPMPATQAAGQPPSGKEAMSLKLQVKIGQKTFTATLEDNPAAAKFRQMLPLTLDMTDLNANEKYYHLDERLPTSPTKPGTIRAGDLLLYGDNSLVIFYETFSSSYSYTRLGKLDDPSGLSEALGKGKIKVTFKVE